MAKQAQNVPGVAPAFRPRGGGCNARKAAKRAIYPWINSQIVATAESGNFGQLVATIQTHAPQMNLVNLATALHRLARQSQGDAGAQLLLTEGAVLANLANHVRAALERAQTSTGPPQCQALANITWSHATMQFVDVSLLQLIADIAVRSLSGFKPFELSTILWAFAKLGEYDPVAWEIGADLFELGVGVVAGSPEDFPFRCLVMTAWAFATSGHHDPDLFRGIAPRMASLAHSGSCRELSTALWAFCIAGVRDERLFLEITRRASQRLEDLTPEELKGMLRSLASVGFVPKAFMDHAVKVADTMDDEEVQRVARALRVLAVPVGDGVEHGMRQRRAHAGSNCSTASGSSRRSLRQHAGSGSSTGSASELSAEEPTSTRRRPRRQGRSGIERQGRKSEEHQPREQVQAWQGESQHFGGMYTVVGFGFTECGEAKPEPDHAVIGALANADYAGEVELTPKTEPSDREEEGKPATGRKASAACWDSQSSWSHLISVKNTFLHVEDEEEPGDVVAYDSLSRPLPPSLDIIPKDVAPERLAAYRTEYQRFRAGGASGARGELSASVV